MAGDAPLAPAVTRRLVEGFAHRRPAPEPPAGLAELTERERAGRRFAGLVQGAARRPRSVARGLPAVRHPGVLDTAWHRTFGIERGFQCPASRPRSWGILGIIFGARVGWRTGLLVSLLVAQPLPDTSDVSKGSEAATLPG